mmetsp:Transcript_21850/g.56990  ORF Transcript_21850/g.56990 Transcript_21850/m.56990 type:complete len:221 (-) Transcript_21850:1301-1963(-)
MRLPASPPGPNPKVPPATQTPCLSPSPLFRQGGKPVGETHCVPRPTGCLFACGPVRAALALLRECVWGGMGAGGTHVQTRQGTGDCSSARGSARDASPMLPHTRRAPSSEVEASRGGGSTPAVEAGLAPLREALPPAMAACLAGRGWVYREVMGPLWPHTRGTCVRSSRFRYHRLLLVVAATASAMPASKCSAVTAPSKHTSCATVTMAASPHAAAAFVV